MPSLSVFIEFSLTMALKAEQWRWKIKQHILNFDTTPHSPTMKVYYSVLWCTTTLDISPQITENKQWRYVGVCIMLCSQHWWSKMLVYIELSDNGAQPTKHFRQYVWYSNQHNTAKLWQLPRGRGTMNMTFYSRPIQRLFSDRFRLQQHDNITTNSSL